MANTKWSRSPTRTHTIHAYASVQRIQNVCTLKIKWKKKLISRKHIQRKCIFYTYGEAACEWWRISVHFYLLHHCRAAVAVAVVVVAVLLLLFNCRTDSIQSFSVSIIFVRFICTLQFVSHVMHVFRTCSKNPVFSSIWFLCSFWMHHTSAYCWFTAPIFHKRWQYVNHLVFHFQLSQRMCVPNRAQQWHRY